MKMTIKEKKAALYDATTKARSHFHAVERKLTKRVETKYPDMPWYDQMDLVQSDPEWQKANGELQGLCLACNIIGIESGE